MPALSCPCGARFHRDAQRATLECPGCELTIGDEASSHSELVIEVAGRLIPWRLWEAESLVAASSSIALSQAMLCGAVTVAIAIRGEEPFSSGAGPFGPMGAILGLAFGLAAALAAHLRLRSSVARWGLIVLEAWMLWTLGRRMPGLLGSGAAVLAALPASQALCVLCALLQPRASRAFRACYRGAPLPPLWRNPASRVSAPLAVNIAKCLAVLSIAVFLVLVPYLFLLMIVPTT